MAPDRGPLGTPANYRTLGEERDRWNEQFGLPVGEIGYQAGIGAAQSLAARVGLKGGGYDDGTRNNAYLHCMWSCLMVSKFIDLYSQDNSADQAEQMATGMTQILTTDHEDANAVGAALSAAEGGTGMVKEEALALMDLWNNEVGRACGAKAGGGLKAVIACIECCEQAPAYIVTKGRDWNYYVTRDVPPSTTGGSDPGQGGPTTPPHDYERDRRIQEQEEEEKRKKEAEELKAMEEEFAPKDEDEEVSDEGSIAPAPSGTPTHGTPGSGASSGGRLGGLGLEVGDVNPFDHPPKPPFEDPCEVSPMFCIGGGGGGGGAWQDAMSGADSNKLRYSRQGGP